MPQRSMPTLSRRGFFTTASAAVGSLALMRARLFARGALSPSKGADIVRTDISKLPPYGNSTLPSGVRSRAVPNVNGMSVHMLKAGYETPGRPAVLLLHGFPELAYS